MAHHEDGKEAVEEGIDISTYRSNQYSTAMDDDDERVRSPTERNPRETHSRDSDNDASTFPSALSRANTYDGDEDVMEQEDRTELKRIATALSRRQSHVAAPTRRQSVGLGTVDEYDATLDPDRREFDLSKWLHRFIRELGEKGLAERQIGVSFRNLDVFGSGDAIQLQATVGSVFTSPLRLGELFSFGKKEPKQILRSFNGLVKSGELLVVLGRPGSGCSTLLKSVCGELHGLSVGENSSISYNGIPQKQMKKEFRGEAIYNQEVDHSFDANTQLMANSPYRSTNTFLTLLSGKPSNLRPLFELHPIVSMTCLAANTVVTLPRLSWQYLVSLIHTIPKSATILFAEYLEVKESVSASRRWFWPARRFLLGIIGSSTYSCIHDAFLTVCQHSRSRLSNGFQIRQSTPNGRRSGQSCPRRCHLPGQSGHLRSF